jgi:hypothetical protein
LHDDESDDLLTCCDVMIWDCEGGGRSRIMMMMTRDEVKNGEIIKIIKECG